MVVWDGNCEVHGVRYSRYYKGRMTRDDVRLEYEARPHKPSGLLLETRVRTQALFSYFVGKCGVGSADRARVSNPGQQWMGVD